MYVYMYVCSICFDRTIPQNPAWVLVKFWTVPKKEMSGSGGGRGFPSKYLPTIFRFMLIKNNNVLLGTVVWKLVKFLRQDVKERLEFFFLKEVYEP